MTRSAASEIFTSRGLGRGKTLRLRTGELTFTIFLDYAIGSRYPSSVSTYVEQQPLNVLLSQGFIQRKPNEEL